MITRFKIFEQVEDNVIYIEELYKEFGDPDKVVEELNRRLFDKTVTIHNLEKDGEYYPIYKNRTVKRFDKSSDNFEKGKDIIKLYYFADRYELYHELWLDDKIVIEKEKKRIFSDIDPYGEEEWD